ncbi:hypothetical protein HY639_04725 [Candidatus Woesearchaeota archaeon]|nr:hypothetical protein [Candidatus Woesearchaeota archaeon]
MVLETKVERNGNATTIRKPDATYTVIYGCHGIPQDSDQLPPDADGVFLETAHKKWIDCKGEESLTANVCRYSMQYGPIFPFLEENGIPTLYGDFRLNERFFGRRLMEINQIDEGIVDRRLKHDQHYAPARRSWQNYLDTMDAWHNAPLAHKLVSAILGIELPPPQPPQVTREWGIHRVIVEKQAPYAARTILRLRELVLAHKQEWLATFYNNPHFVTIIGAMHTKLEDALLMDAKDRTECIKRMAPTIVREVAPNKAFYTIASCVYKEDKWVTELVYEIPELRSLIFK